VLRLEDRTAPATVTWVGDVDANWGTNIGLNTNWSGDVLPHNGDSLVFPANGLHKTNTNNMSGLTLADITISGNPYVIGGNAVTLTDNLTDSSPSTGAVISLPINLSNMFHISHVFFASGHPLSPTIIRGVIGETGGQAYLGIAGGGPLEFESSGNTYTGFTQVSDAQLLLHCTGPGAATFGNLELINGGVVRELGNNQIYDLGQVTMSLPGVGGQLSMNGFSDIVGSVQIDAGGQLVLNADSAGGGNLGRLDTGLLSVVNGTVHMRVVDAINSDRIIAYSVQLGGSLDLTGPPMNLPLGTTITLIDNQSSNAVSGTFSGLPEGAILGVGGESFVLSYIGGTGNDVVLTRVPELTVTGTQVNDGAAQRSRVTSLTVTFSLAQVSFAGTPAAAFTLIRNSDNAPVTFAASVAIVNGVTAVTLNNFSGPATNFGSLADGRYTLMALAGQISGPGGHLDGNGDGVTGDNYTFGDAQGLFRFFGDINGDRHVDIADFAIFSNSFNSNTGQTNYLAYLDFNGDGHIDIADFGQFSIRFFTVLP
jgi:hypothetical protein